MTLSHEPLVDLAGRLGLADDALARVEHVNRLAGTFEVHSHAVATLSTDVVRGFAAAYTSAGRLTIGTGDLVEFTVDGGEVDEGELRRLVEEAGRLDTTYRVVIAIDKDQLLADVVPDATDVVARLFFFRDVFERYLEQAPAHVQRDLWHDTRKRLVIVLLDGSAHVSGTCLSVVHADREAVATEIAKGLPAHLGRLADRRNDYIGWDNALSTELTPMHFELPADAAESLRARLAGLAIGLGAMYLCDRARDVTRPDGSSFTQVEFRAREHVAFIPVHWEEALPGISGPQVDAVLDVVTWCYESIPEHRATDLLADRLPFVQARVAQLLENRSEEDRLVGFALVMPAIAEGVKWYWRSFIEDRISEYLDHVRELESVTGDVVGRLSEQTGALVKRLTETSLAAVAALIGSFIAATFKDPFQEELFRIAMLAYAGYVLVFPFGIGIASSVGDARLSFSGYEAQRDTLGGVLGHDRVEEIVGDRPTRARARFRFWAWTVGLLYTTAVVAAVVAAIAVPSVVEDSGTSSPTTTPAIQSEPGE
ncbi:MAG: hypothetical protein ACLGHT_10760 [Acidimicrobiia bacterium]